MHDGNKFQVVDYKRGCVPLPTIKRHFWNVGEKILQYRIAIYLDRQSILLLRNDVFYLYIKDQYRKDESTVALRPTTIDTNLKKKKKKD